MAKLAGHVRQRCELQSARDSDNLLLRRVTGYYRSLFFFSAPGAYLAADSQRANESAANFRASLELYAEEERVTP